MRDSCAMIQVGPMFSMRVMWDPLDMVGAFFTRKASIKSRSKRVPLKKKVGPARVFWRVKKMFLLFMFFCRCFREEIYYYCYLLLCWKEMIVVGYIVWSSRCLGKLNWSYTCKGNTQMVLVFFFRL